MKKILRRLKLISIDVYIYQMMHYQPFNDVKLGFNIQKFYPSKSKICYFVEDDGSIIHKSYLFSKVFLLKSIDENGPVIGDCKTSNKYRGKSIYPFVINKIAKDVIENEQKPVFIIVDKSNTSSIKGIKKSGFTKLASIEAKRWLWFYLKKNIKYYND